MNRTRGRGRGFTLIELLIVITVIAVLIAMFLPSINLVMRHFAKMRCGMNLHNMSQVFGEYAARYKGYLPCFGSVTEIKEWDEVSEGSGWKDGGTPKGHHVMVEELKSMGASAQMFTCPSDSAYENPESKAWNSWTEFVIQPTSTYWKDKIVYPSGYSFFIGSDGLYKNPKARNTITNYDLWEYPLSFKDFLNGQRFARVAAEVGNPPIVSDLLRFSSGSGYKGFNHTRQPDPDNIQPGGGGHTLFVNGTVDWFDWSFLEDAVGPVYATPWNAPSTWYYCAMKLSEEETDKDK